MDSIGKDTNSTAFVVFYTGNDIGWKMHLLPENMEGTVRDATYTGT